AKGIQSAKTKMNAEGPAEPLQMSPEVWQTPTLLDIKFTDYRTPYTFFNEVDVANPKRTRPAIFTAIEAQAEFLMGAARVQEIIRDPNTGQVMIGVLKNRDVTQNDTRKMKDLIRRRGQRGAQPPAAGRGPQVPPGAPGSMPPGGPMGG